MTFEIIEKMKESVTQGGLEFPAGEFSQKLFELANDLTGETFTEVETNADNLIDDFMASKEFSEMMKPVLLKILYASKIQQEQ